MKKRILCFGDSNTYGYDPSDGTRYDETIRWPMRLQYLLGESYTVVEEGFNGRTFCYDDPIEGAYKSGIQYLPPCLMSHNPLDLVIIMLGTNDLKKRFNLNAATMAYFLQIMAQCVRQYAKNGEGTASKILIVSPPEIGEGIRKTLMAPIFGEDAPERSREMKREFSRYARLCRCEFLAASDYCEPGSVDSLHLSAEGHRQLAEGIANKVRSILL